MSVVRHSSLRTDLGALLRSKLRGARRYLRIAGYFRSSLLEIAGEELEDVEEVLVVCNGDLDPHDIAVAKAAKQGGPLDKAILSRWLQDTDRLDSLVRRDRYRRLHALLSSGRLKVRVLSGDTSAFVHGKAGVIEYADGSSVAFVGSANDSRSAWDHNYEIVWEDAAPDACRWVREEWVWFWDRGVDLPNAVVRTIGVQAARTEYKDIAEWRDADPDPSSAPAAAIVNRPLYLAGNLLRPWQKRFVHTCIHHHNMFGRARLLLADDVGLGKTLSVAAAALVLSLLDAEEKPVLILVPSTVMWQWQVELNDMLGLPASVWSTAKKAWIDNRGFEASGRGPEYIVRCPTRIGIVSTGVIVNGSPVGEKAHLSRMSFGILVLDEVHKARAKRDLNSGIEGHNNLMAFMIEAAKRARHVLVASATPIQLHAVELWDIIFMLSQGAPHVLGRSSGYRNEWVDPAVMDYMTGERSLPNHPVTQWELLKNPLAPASDDPFYRQLRSEFGISDQEVVGPRYEDLDHDYRTMLRDEFPRLFQQTNPIIRHTVRRSRPMLEERSLLKRIAVEIHPEPGLVPANLLALDGGGLRMGLTFETAYEAARRFCEVYARNRPGAGFMKTILLRRVGSSVKAGYETATKLLAKGGKPIEMPEAEVGDGERIQAMLMDLPTLSPEERQLLTEVRNGLSDLLDAPDPKADVIVHYLREMRWLERGSVIFSQYLDTALWIADRLADSFPLEPIAVYAGGGNSFVRVGDDVRHVEREDIKRGVWDGQIRLMCCTDAAAEGLNLQKLSTQINVDLPWNPAKLEQRKGRVQRIGQTRDSIGVMNLRYAGTVEDDVYTALSERFQDIFAVLGQLPDSFEDEWVDAVLGRREEVKYFASRIDIVRTPMEQRYGRDVADDEGLNWEEAVRVLSDRNVEEHMRTPW